MRKRLISMALALSMVLSMLPMLSSAEGAWHCGLETHTHGVECKAQDYVCGLEADGEHVHEDACYTLGQVLACVLPETHEHGEGCLETRQKQICTQQEAHAHGESCYGPDGGTVCGLIQCHVHEDGCTDDAGAVVCGFEAVHVHGEDCYTQEQVEICQLPLSHTHEGTCYEDQQVLTCDIHVHADVCMGEVLTCQKQEHTHSIACQCNCETLCTEASTPECVACGADKAHCKGELPVVLCSHEVEQAQCAVCAVVAAIDALPAAESWLALTDNDQRLTHYNTAQSVTDQYNALTEDQQGQVSNFDKLIALHEAFNRQVAPAAQVQKAANPTGLEWGVHYQLTSSGDPNSLSYTRTYLTGAIKWQSGGADGRIYQLAVYRVGEEWPITNVPYYRNSPEYENVDIFSTNTFLRQMLEHCGPGSYYFTVKALGDGVAYTDSDTVTSPVWEYTLPAQVLPTPVNYGIKQTSNGIMSGMAFPDAENISGRMTVYQYSATGDFQNSYDNPVFAEDFSFSEPGKAIYSTLPPHVLENGAGYYRCKVRVLSGDVTKVQDSAWSEYSEAFYYSPTGEGECQHTAHTKKFVDYSYSSIDDTQHTKTAIYDRVCANAACGVVLQKWDPQYNEETTENHTLTNGACLLCGYGPLHVTTTAKKTAVHAGEEIGADAAIVGGSGVYSTIYWSVKKGADVVYGPTPHSVPTFTWTAADAGSYSITCRVVDSMGAEYTHTSGAITVEAHRMEEKTTSTLSKVSAATQDGHYMTVSTYEECSACHTTTEPTTVEKLVAHKNATAMGYEAAHPHNQYRVCETCGWATYTGTHYTANGAVQDAAECCVCLGHRWGSTQYQTGHPHQGYQQCACGKLQSLNQYDKVDDCKACYPPEPVTPPVELVPEEPVKPVLPVEPQEPEYPEVDDWADLLMQLRVNEDKTTLTGITIEDGKITLQAVYQAGWNQSKTFTVDANLGDWSPVILEKNLIGDDVYHLNPEFFEKYNLHMDQQIEWNLDKDLYIESGADLSNFTIHSSAEVIVTHDSGKKAPQTVSLTVYNCDKLTVQGNVQADVKLVSELVGPGNLELVVEDEAKLSLSTDTRIVKNHTTRKEEVHYQRAHINNLTVKNDASIVFTGNGIQVNETLKVQNKAEIAGTVTADTVVYDSSVEACSAVIHAQKIEIKDKVSFAGGELHLPKDPMALEGGKKLESLDNVYYGDGLLADLKTAVTVQPNDPVHKELGQKVAAYQPTAGDPVDGTVDYLKDNGYCLMNKDQSKPGIDKNLENRITENILALYVGSAVEIPVDVEGNTFPVYTKGTLEFEGYYRDSANRNVHYRCEVEMIGGLFGQVQLGDVTLHTDGQTHSLVVATTPSVTVKDMKDTYEAMEEMAKSYIRDTTDVGLDEDLEKLLLEGFGVQLPELKKEDEMYKQFKEWIKYEWDLDTGAITVSGPAEDPLSAIKFLQGLMK